MADEPAAVRSAIRPRRSDDLPECARALVAVHHSDGYPVEGVADPEGWLQPPGFIEAWVARSADRITGHVAISEVQPSDGAAKLWMKESSSPVEEIAVLGRLFVIPEARGYAAGESLVIAAMDRAREIGRRLVLDVMEKDVAAIRLYERLDWRHIGPVAHEFGEGWSAPAHCYVSPP